MSRYTTSRPARATRPDLIGIVRRVDEQEERAQWSDLGRGVLVAIFGQFDDDGRTLTARLIVIRPPQLP